MSASLIVAWLLMPACGAAIYLAMAPQPAPARSAAALGYGVLIGVFATAGATALLARTDTAHAFAHTAPWLAALGAAAAAHAWRRMRRRAHACAPMEKMEKWKIALFLAVPVALAWRGWLALDEVLLRPTYPWDAWDAWAV
ncbi:MAG TPA: hypothetical protein VFB32_10485, partial [Rudaea sp.]|nr:hypothetical protein [Rudaea sp.]